MKDADSRRVIAVRPGSNPRRAREVIRWIRCLLPAAVLLVGPPSWPEGDADGVISIDVDAVVSGPLALADALARDPRRC